MTLYTILFGDFQAPQIVRTRVHRLDGANVEPTERTGTITSQVVETVRRHNGLSATEITSSIGASYGTVMNSLVRLMARGQLRRVKTGASYKYFGV